MGKFLLSKLTHVVDRTESFAVVELGASVSC